MLSSLKQQGLDVGAHSEKTGMRTSHELREAWVTSIWFKPPSVFFKCQIRNIKIATVQNFYIY